MVELPEDEEELFVICRTIEVQDEEVRGFTLARLNEEEKPEPWPILITRKGSNFYGYENSCPHQGVRLDVVPGEFTDEDGHFITCGKHNAQFDMDTGHCFIGPCQGERLPPIKLIIDDGDICITGVPLTDEDGMHLGDPNSPPDVMITSD